MVSYGIGKGIILNYIWIALGNYTSREDIVDAVNRKVELQSLVQVMFHVATRRSNVQIIDKNIILRVDLSCKKYY